MASSSACKLKMVPEPKWRVVIVSPAKPGLTVVTTHMDVRHGGSWIDEEDRFVMIGRHALPFACLGLPAVGGLIRQRQ